MKESFTYLFKDNKWLIKFLTVFLFITIATYGGHFYSILSKNSEFVLPFKYWIPMTLGCAISYIITAGYKIICVKAFQVAKTNRIAPFVRLKIDFIVGFKYLCASGLFHICCSIIIAIFCFMTGLSMALPGERVLMMNVCSTLMLLSIVIYVVYWALTELGYVYMYAENPCFLNFFKIKQLTSCIFKHKKQYFSAVGYNIIINIFIFFSFLLINCLFLYKASSIKALVINTLLMSIIGTYKLFITNMLIAKSLEGN